MARTVAPAGNFPVALAGLGWLIASAPSFQLWVGASGEDAATQALAHVSFDADDTEESGSTRPRAIIDVAEGGWSEEKVSLQNFRPSIKLLVSFEDYPAADIEAETPREDRLWDEKLAFANNVQAVVADCEALQGSGSGYVSGISHITTAQWRLAGGPCAVQETRAEGQQGETPDYFYGLIMEVDIHG